MAKGILVAMDGSKPSAAALQEAIKMAQERNVPITVLHVQNDIPVYGDAFVAQETIRQSDEMRDFEQNLLADAKATCQKAGVASSALMISGSPGWEISKLSGNYDLVVLGSTGHSTLYSLLLGSTSAYVCEHAKCSVFVVRAKAD